MIDRSEIIRAALLITDLESGPKSNRITERYQRQRSNKRTWLEWAMNFTMRLPDDKKQRGIIIDYARGVRSDCRVVRRYVDSIPDDAWVEGEYISSLI